MCTINVCLIEWVSKTLYVEAHVWWLWLSLQCLRVIKDFASDDFAQFGDIN